jgi:hypothetical protein
MARLALTLLLVVSAGLAQTKSMRRGSHRIEITLEQRTGDKWMAVDPALVFDRDARVRFRFRTNFDGYLYVTNQSTSGAYRTLFPSEETGRENRVESGKEYLVPATEGWFRIAGPAGHDIVYWLLTPTELGRPEPPARLPLPPPPPLPPDGSSLTPRCDDTLLRARGECLDSSAGPRKSDAASDRDFVIIRERNTSVVSSPAPLKEPVMYEFRIAHR